MYPTDRSRVGPFKAKYSFPQKEPLSIHVPVGWVLVLSLKQAVPEDTPTFKRFCVSNLSADSESAAFFSSALSSLDLLSLRSWSLVVFNLVSAVLAKSRTGAEILLTGQLQSSVSVQEICTGVQHFPNM